MVEECCKFVNQTPDIETKLKFIDTLRTVTEGKVGFRVGSLPFPLVIPLPPCVFVLDIC
jgi:hypothetical protein